MPTTSYEYCCVIVDGSAQSAAELSMRLNEGWVRFDQVEVGSSIILMFRREKTG